MHVFIQISPAVRFGLCFSHFTFHGELADIPLSSSSKTAAPNTDTFDSVDDFFLVSRPICDRLTKAKLIELAKDVPPKSWTFAQYSAGSFDKSSSGHYRRLSASRSGGFIQTWWNMASTSATSSWRNLVRTLTKLFVQSGPWCNCLFSDVPLYLAEQWKTTITLPSLCMGDQGLGDMVSACRTGLPLVSISVSGTLEAYPLSM